MTVCTLGGRIPRASSAACLSLFNKLSTLIEIPLKAKLIITKVYLVLLETALEKQLENFRSTKLCLLSFLSA